MGSHDVGDRVRIDIPGESDSNHQYPAEHETITNIISDDAGEPTKGNRDSDIYRIEPDNDGRTVDVYYRDLQSPFSGGIPE